MTREMLCIDNSPTLTAIHGPMYSGKSSDLVERISIDEQVLEYKALLFKPIIDTRYAIDKVVSHSGKEHDALNIDIEAPEQIIAHILEAEKDGVPVEVVGIDEAQFFASGVVEVVEDILAHGKKVYVAGLPTNFRGETFGSMGDLITRADIHVPRVAKCMYKKDTSSRACGDPATKTQRIIDGVPADYDSPIILVGAKEAYEARCRVHHMVPGKPEVIYSSGDSQT